MCARRLSSSAGTVKFRPFAQNLLHEEDILFDLRLYLMKKTEVLCHELYSTALLSLHDQLIQNVANECTDKRFLSNKASLNVRTLFLRSYLSDADTNALVNYILQHITRTSDIVMADCLNLSRRSAHEVLIELAKSMLKYLLDERYNNKESSLIKRKNRIVSSIPVSNLVERLEINPAQVIHELYSTYFAPMNEDSSHRNESNNKANILLVFRNVDSLSAEVFGEVLERLHLIPKINFILFGIHAAAQELPFILLLPPNPTAIFQASSPLSFSTSTSSSLYDATMKALYCNEDLPLHIPSKLIGTIHANFFRAHKCVATSLLEFLAIYRFHMSESPCSVLAGYRNKDFLQSVIYLSFLLYSLFLFLLFFFIITLVFSYLSSELTPVTDYLHTICCVVSHHSSRQ